MAHDDRLAARVRAVLEPLATDGPVEEKALFGGLAFMVAGHMTVCVSGQGGLLVRVDASERPALLELPQVEPMVMAGRPSRTWLRVDDEGVALDDDLEQWVRRGLDVVRSLPPKR